MKFALIHWLTACDCFLMLSFQPTPTCSQSFLFALWMGLGQWLQIWILLPSPNPREEFGYFSRKAAAWTPILWVDQLLRLMICRLCWVVQHNVNLDELCFGLLEDPWHPFQVDLCKIGYLLSLLNIQRTNFRCCMQIWEWSWSRELGKVSGGSAIPHSPFSHSKDLLHWEQKCEVEYIGWRAR